jgi:hypothetical protein
MEQRDAIDGVLALVQAVDAEVLMSHRRDTWLVLVECNGHHGVGVDARLDYAASQALHALQYSPDEVT